MKMKWMMSCCAVLIWCLAVEPVQAQQRIRGEYANSRQPYWKVGTLNKELSNACQRGEFRQRRYLVYSIGFRGQKGRGITGIARKDWNLIDVNGLAKPNMTYHFFNQGYSDCQVFEAITPPKPRRK